MGRVRGRKGKRKNDYILILKIKDDIGMEGADLGGGRGI